MFSMNTKRNYKLMPILKESMPEEYADHHSESFGISTETFWNI